MCMITYLPAGVMPDLDAIENGATYNRDGHGWAVAAETGVILQAHYMDIDVALVTFEATRRAFPDAPALFHSRFATHGSTSLANVHPFNVGRWAVVAHNGILPTKFQPRGKDDRSDTAILADEFLSNWASISGVWSRRGKRRVGRIIGSGNKLCILSASPYLERPKGILVNAHMGEWSDGAWYSNKDYRARYNRHDDWWTADEGWWSTPKGSTSIVEIGRKATAEDVYTDRTCILCGTKGQIDIVSNVCLACDSCLDCLEPMRACQCHYPESSLSHIHGFNEED